MAYPQTAPATPVPVPVKGMNTRDPVAAMDPNYAPWVLNFEPEPQYLRVRNGYVQHCDLTAQCDSVIHLGAYGFNKLLAYGRKSGSNDAIYNVTHADYKLGIAYAVGERARNPTNNRIYQCATTIPVATTMPTGAGAGEADGTGTWNYVASALEYTTATDVGDAISVNMIRRIFYLRTAGCVYTGSAWASSALTSGGSAISAACATLYRGRIYLFKLYQMFYGIVGQVTGSMTLVDLESLMDASTQIVWAGTLTDATNKPTESMIAFGTENGEVFVYSGDNPGATNWEQIAKIKLAPMLNYQNVLQIQGDIWIPTVTGIISLRKAMAKGADNLDDISVSSAIDPYWRKVVAAKLAQYKSTSFNVWTGYYVKASIAYWPEQNKVYVSIRGKVDVDGVAASGDTSTVFVCNLYSGAWTIHQSDTILNALNNVTYFNDGLYFPTDKIVYKVGSGYQDQAPNSSYYAIPYALHSAYTNLGGKFGQCVGLEPLMKTDFTGSSVTMKSSVDFGRKVSAACSHALIDGHQSPFYAAGNQGSYIQYRMEGNSDLASTDGLELYSMGVAIK